MAQIRCHGWVGTIGMTTFYLNAMQHTLWMHRLKTKDMQCVHAISMQKSRTIMKLMTSYHYIVTSMPCKQSNAEMSKTQNDFIMVKPKLRFQIKINQNELKGNTFHNKQKGCVASMPKTKSHIHGSCEGASHLRGFTMEKKEMADHGLGWNSRLVAAPHHSHTLSIPLSHSGFGEAKRGERSSSKKIAQGNPSILSLT